jgi:uncharacterized phage protein (predicted DNA packaging)
MIVTLEEAKAYLRIDSSYDDLLISSLITASEEYLKNATGVEYDSSNELAKLFCLVLISDWYENREMVGKEDNVRQTIRSILMQLTYCLPSEE